MSNGAKKLGKFCAVCREIQWYAYLLKGYSKVEMHFVQGFVCDDRLSKNGFEVKLSKNAEGNLAPMITAMSQEINFFGVQDLVVSVSF